MVRAKTWVENKFKEDGDEFFKFWRRRKLAKIKFGKD